MNTYLLITSIVIFLCILLNRVSNRIGIPALLAFIVLGMLFGSDGIMKIDFDNYAFAEQICSTAVSYTHLHAALFISSISTPFEISDFSFGVMVIISYIPIRPL